MSSTALYTVDNTGMRAAEPPRELGGPGDLLAGIVPGFDMARAGVGLTNTDQRYRAPLYAGMLRELERQGIKAPDRKVEFLGATLLTMPGRYTNPAYESRDRFGRQQRAEDLLFSAWKQARAANPNLPDWTNREKVDAELGKRRQTDLQAAQARVPDSLAGETGSFVGAIGAGFTDPTVLLSMGIGAGAVQASTIGRTIALRAGAEAVAQAGVAAVTVPFLFEDAEQAGLDYSAEDAAIDVALGAILGGTVGAVSGAVDTGAVRQLGRQAAAVASEAGEVAATSTRALVRKLRELGRPLTADEADALKVLETEADIEDINPYGPTPEGQALHRAKLEEAADALVSGRPVGIADDAALPDGVSIRPEVMDEAAKGFDPKPHLEKGRAWVASGGSLQPAKVAQALGLSEPEADRLLTVMAAEPNSGLFVTKPKWTRDADGVRQLVPGKVRRVPQVKGPEDVLDFLARRGGLRNDEGHALDEIGGLANHFTPNFGGGPLIRPGGMSLEQAQEALEQAGYFGERGFSAEGRTAQIQTADLLELLAAADLARQKGKRLYSPFDPKLGDGVARELDRGREADAAAKAETRDSLVETFARDGMDPGSPAEIEEMLQAWRRYTENLPVDRAPDAVDFLTYHLDDAEFEAVRAARGETRAAFDDDFDVPFDDAMDGPYGDDPGAVAGGQPRGGAEGSDGPAPFAGDAGEGAVRAEDQGQAGGGQGREGEPPAALEAAVADATTARAFAEFDDPDGPAAQAQTDQLLHDLRAAIDPAIAERNRQMAQLGADSPLRPGDRAEQADVDGLPMFDAARSPDLFSAPDEPDARALLEELDAEEAELAALRKCLDDPGAGA